MPDNQLQHDKLMQQDNRYCYFFEESEFEETDRPGFRRRVITGEHLQMFFWRIKGGSQGSFMHHHVENEQLGVIMRGRLEFSIGSESSDESNRVALNAGECYLAPFGVWHGDSTFVGDDEYDECWILDVFSPPRTDGLTGSPDRAAEVPETTTTNGDRS